MLGSKLREAAEKSPTSPVARMVQVHDEKIMDAHSFFETEKKFQIETGEIIKEEDAHEVLKAEALNFLGGEVEGMDQEAVSQKLRKILLAISNTDTDTFGLFAFSLPHSATAEDIQNGTSASAKVYRALFELSSDPVYSANPALQEAAFVLANVVSQDPQMIGPIALWQIAKDFLWRRDVSHHLKDDLMGSMTYALAFMQTEKYQSELLRQLDFTDPTKFTETSHLLEAMRQFWSSGQEGYAQDSGVPEFFVKALAQVEETDTSNYLLALRAHDIQNAIYEGEEFLPPEQDRLFFEITKGVYAIRRDEGIFLVPEENTEEALALQARLEAIEGQLRPPQHMVGEAIQNGEKYVMWQPDEALMKECEELFVACQKYANVPLTSVLATSEVENISQASLFDYEYLLSKPVREMIEHNFGLNVTELSIREQFYFLNYLKTTTIKDVPSMQDFIKEQGVPGMRTFLSLEKDGTLGKDIISFAMYEVDGELAGEVFELYGSLLDSADTAASYVEANVVCEQEECAQLVNQLRTNILSRAQKFLSTSVRSKDMSGVIEKLKHFSLEATLFTSAFKALKEQGGEVLHWEQIKDASFEQVDAAEITPEDKTTMQKIWESHYGGKYESKKLEETLRQQFEESFEKPNIHFYLFKHKGEIVSYFSSEIVGTTEDGKPKKHLASFMTSQSYEGGSLGQAVMEKGLDEEQKGSILVGECDVDVAKTPIVEKYFEKYNFIGTKCYEEDGEPTLALERREGESFQTKALSQEEVKRRAELHTSNATEKYVVSDTVPDFQSELQNGFILTRYFIASDTGQKKYYAAFELDSAPAPSLR